jgi:hypothetical protein
MNEFETYFYDRIINGDADIFSVSFNQKIKRFEGYSGGFVRNYPQLVIEFTHKHGQQRPVYLISGKGFDREYRNIASVTIDRQWLADYRIEPTEGSKLFQKIENLIQMPIDEYTHGEFNHEGDYPPFDNIRTI